MYRTVSLVSHVPLTCKTFGVDCSSCRVATTMTLTYSCSSCSKLYPLLGRLLIVFLSLPVLTVIVSPLWGSIACFVVIKSRFCRCRVWNRGVDFLGRTRHVNMRPTPSYVSCSNLYPHLGRLLIALLYRLWSLPVVHHRRCGFSLPVVSGIHLVMSSDHLILVPSFHRDTVWGDWANDKKFRLEKSIRARIRSNYDLLSLTQFLLNCNDLTTVGILRSRAF